MTGLVIYVTYWICSFQPLLTFYKTHQLECKRLHDINYQPTFSYSFRVPTEPRYGHHWRNEKNDREFWIRLTGNRQDATSNQQIRAGWKAGLHFGQQTTIPKVRMYQRSGYLLRSGTGQSQNKTFYFHKRKTQYTVVRKQSPFCINLTTTTPV